MNMKNTVVICPHCNSRINVALAVHPQVKIHEVIQCYSENSPSCGRDFVLDYSFVFTYQTRKIAPDGTFEHVETEK